MKQVQLLQQLNSVTVQGTIFRGPWVPRDCVTALSLLPSPPFLQATDGLANLGNGSFSPPVLFSAVLVTVFKDCSLHQNFNYFNQQGLFSRWSPLLQLKNVMEFMSIGFPLIKIVMGSGSDQAFRIERRVCHISQFLSWKGRQIEGGTSVMGL